MMETLELFVRPSLGIAALLYLVLAVHVARAGPKHGSSVIAFFFVLAGMLVAGAAFSYGTNDADIYGIGRTLTFFASGFLPVVFYVVYREYTVGPPSAILIAMLSVIPITTTVLTLTNSMHNIIWAVVASESGPYFTDVTEHYWFNRVHLPFMYGLFLYTASSSVRSCRSWPASRMSSSRLDRSNSRSQHRHLPCCYRYIVMLSFRCASMSSVRSPTRPCSTTCATRFL